MQQSDNTTQNNKMNEIKSRQVVKTRKGDSIPILPAKRRRFSSVLYSASELKKLDILLENNDVNLEGNLILYS